MSGESFRSDRGGLLVPLSFSDPHHRYGIMQRVEQLSAPRVRLAVETLYGVPETLLETGWIRALPEETGGRKGICHHRGRDAGR